MMHTNLIRDRAAWCAPLAVAALITAGSAPAAEWVPSKNVDIKRNAWAEDFMASAETRKHLDRENDVMTAILTDLGLAK